MRQVPAWLVSAAPREAVTKSSKTVAMLTRNPDRRSCPGAWSRELPARISSASQTRTRARRGSGRLALLIATDTPSVAELSRRAREHSVAAGAVVGVGVEVTVGVGDLVVTRQNDRRLSVAGCWVKNADRWAVTATHDDGRVTVQQEGDLGEVTLPASYVSEYVEVAYATTAYQTQGGRWTPRTRSCLRPQPRPDTTA